MILGNSTALKSKEITVSITFLYIHSLKKNNYCDCDAWLVM